MLVSSALGIDFGSQTIKIGAVKRGGVEVLTNEGSHRENPNIVGFSDNERLLGESGALKVSFLSSRLA